MSTEYYTQNPEARAKHNERCKLKAKERYQNDTEYREKQRAKSRARYAAKKLVQEASV